jgi:hypothetical protein
MLQNWPLTDLGFQCLKEFRKIMKYLEQENGKHDRDVNLGLQESTDHLSMTLGDLWASGMYVR